MKILKEVEEKNYTLVFIEQPEVDEKERLRRREQAYKVIAEILLNSYKSRLTLDK